ncbi:hypothetical protein BDK92_0359 [Micromonospora pisi]|uniref:Lipoprotein n=1 Tax=Micromonospora pisi TaxID=589240 RepID=A0A495JB34_9ACTN|nr:hypothetical protein [Micromonospora pisi]RKR86137.1 hypothetical protein BDK92_0359 [Micromonospora pisi]
MINGVTGVRARSAIVGLVVAVAGLVGCVGRDDPAPDQQTRVDQAFQRYADGVREKEGVSEPPTQHLLAGTDQLPNGTRISLWVTDPVASDHLRARCYYLDLEDHGGWVSGFGGCGGADDQVTVNRNSEIVFGTVGTWPATMVRITRGGPPTEVTVTGGWFLVPHAVSEPTAAGYAIVLVGADGATLGTVRDLTPPASVTPVT